MSESQQNGVTQTKTCVRLTTKQTVVLVQYISKQFNLFKGERVSLAEAASRAARDLGFPVTKQHIINVRDDFDDLRWPLPKTGHGPGKSTTGVLQNALLVAHVRMCAALGVAPDPCLTEHIRIAKEKGLDFKIGE